MILHFAMTGVLLIIIVRWVRHTSTPDVIKSYSVWLIRTAEPLQAWALISVWELKVKSLTWLDYSVLGQVPDRDKTLYESVLVDWIGLS